MLRSRLSPLVVLCAMTTPAWAIDTDKIATTSNDSAPACCASKAASTDMAESTCPVTQGMSKLPKIVYMVGSDEICCSEMAKAKAEETKSEVTYLVGEDKFTCPDAAFTALVDKTETFVANFAKPQTCSVSGNISIAGETCSCSVQAGTIAKKVQSAMDAVLISYKVGDKSCSCPNEAKAIASESHAKTHFVVDGEETECEMTARLNLARAKYKAALLATVAPATDKDESVN